MNIAGGVISLTLVEDISKRTSVKIVIPVSAGIIVPRSGIIKSRNFLSGQVISTE